MRVVLRSVDESGYSMPPRRRRTESRTAPAHDTLTAMPPCTTTPAPACSTAVPVFENDCAKEVSAACADIGYHRYAKAKPGYRPAGRSFRHGDEALPPLRAELRFADLVFARQLVFCSVQSTTLLPCGRPGVPALVDAVKTLGPAGGNVY